MTDLLVLVSFLIAVVVTAFVWYRIGWDACAKQQRPVKVSEILARSYDENRSLRAERDAAVAQADHLVVMLQAADADRDAALARVRRLTTRPANTPRSPG